MMKVIYGITIIMQVQNRLAFVEDGMDGTMGADAAHVGVQQRLYLDDLRVGQRFASRSHRIDEAELTGFAGVYDPQPFHLDDAAARETLFGGLAASGWHTAAVTMRLNVESGLPFAGGLIGAGAELSWPRPTRPGDVLRVVSEIREVAPSRSRPDRGMVTVKSLTLNQRDEVVQILVAKLVVPRAPGAHTPRMGAL